jgi:glycosyltransferase 2 family protein
VSASAGEPKPRRGLPPSVEKLFRTSMVLIPIGVLGNIVFSLLTTDRALLTSLAGFDRGYLMLAVGLALLPWLTHTVRLAMWTRFLGYGIGYRESFRITLANDLGAAVSPTAVGGGLFKWGLLVQRGVSPGAAVSLTTLPTVEDAIFFAVALPLAVVYTASWNLPVFDAIGERVGQNALVLLPVVVGIAALSWLAVRLVLSGQLGRQARRRGLRFTGRTRRRLRVTWRDAREVFAVIMRRGRLLFAFSLSLTALQWMARYSVISALIAFLGVPVDPVLFWLLQWVVFSLMAMVPTPGAAGGAEAIFFLIYSAFVPAGIIGLATAGWRFLTFYLQLGLAAILFAWMGMRDGALRTDKSAG